MKTSSASGSSGPSAPSLKELRASRGGPPKGWRRFRGWIIAGGGLVALGLFGFFGLPPIVKAQAIKQLSQRLGRDVVIEKVRINPLVLSATIEGFSISEAGAAAGEFTGWRRFYANFDSWSLFVGELRFQEIALDGFRARVALDGRGEFNFADILAKLAADAGGAEAAGPEAGGEDAKPLALEIGRLDVTDAQVFFNDASRSREFATVAGPLTFSLRNFHTVGEPNAPYQFEAVTSAGERLAWKGTVSADPVKSQGELVLANIDLARLSPYYHEMIAGELRSALVDISGRYTFELREGAPALTLDEGAFTLRDVRLGAPGEEADAFALRSLAVTGVSADSVGLTAAIGKVAIDGVRVRATRDAEGIDLLRLVTPRVAASAPAATDVPSAPAVLPKVTLGELGLSDVRVDLVDLTTPRRAEHRIENIAFTLRDLDSADLAKSLPLALEVTLPEEGRVALSGTVAAQPLAAELDVVLEHVPFANASPYVEPFLNIRLAGGTVRTTGRATLRDGVVDFAGDFGIAEFRTVDGKLAQDFLTWTDFAVTGIRASSAPPAFHAQEIRFVEPGARVRIEADGSLNISQTAASRPTASEAPDATPTVEPVAPSAGLPVAVTVGTFAFEKASFRFEDRSISPVARGAISDFGGKISGLSSEALGRADVDLRGLVDGVAPIAITGKLNPLGTPAFMDLKLTFTGIDLQPSAGPYVGKFVGRELARGNLNVAISAKLADRNVDTTNVVTLDQFYLGEKTDSADATSLPVGLALALLRDTQGRIVIDLPVKGSLDDPEFKIGRVVVRVLTNILTKAATSPFSLLGAAFGGGGDELGWQDFAPGSALADEAGIKKLDTVARALNGRPALRLDLAGAYDPVRDRDAMRRARLEDAVRALAWETRRQVDVNTPPPDQLEITPDLRAGMIARLYASAFPPVAGEPAPRVLIGEADAGRTVPLVPGAVTAPRSPFDPVPVEQPRRQVGRLPRFGGGASTSNVGSSGAELSLPPSVDPAAGGDTPDASTAAPTISLSQMEARLAEQIEIAEAELQALGEARAQSIRARLLDAGKIAPERIFLSPIKAGGTRVNLDLK